MVSDYAPSKLPITVEDFARIHGVIRSILSAADVSPADLARSCVFFAIAGAYLLQKKHGLNAAPAAGAAFIAVSEANGVIDVLSFAKKDEQTGQWCSDHDAFHAWTQVVDAEGQLWIIDFTSPLYADGIRKYRPGANPGYKAFIRLADEMLVHPDRLQTEATVGDFFMQENREHTAALLLRVAKDAQVADLVSIASQWYVAAPGKMADDLMMGDNKGVVRKLRFKPPRLAGVWLTQSSRCLS